MRIKFYNFQEKSAKKFCVMGFGAPENAKNHLFHAFWVIKPTVKHRSVSFFTKN